MYTLHFDGLFRSISGGFSSHQTGVMCYGWLIEKNGKVIARGHGGLASGKDATSNTAEYLGLIEGLEALLDLGVKNEAVRVYGDARSVIDQMTGESAVSTPRVKPYHQRASRLAKHFENIEWNWTPRRHNRSADELTRRAFQQIQRDSSRFQSILNQLAPGKGGTPSSKAFPLLDLRVFGMAGVPA